jgi:hypothetical protein
MTMRTAMSEESRYAVGDDEPTTDAVIDKVAISDDVAVDEAVATDAENLPIVVCDGRRPCLATGASIPGSTINADADYLADGGSEGQRKLGGHEGRLRFARGRGRAFLFTAVYPKNPVPRLSGRQIARVRSFEPLLGNIAQGEGEAESEVRARAGRSTEDSRGRLGTAGSTIPVVTGQSDPCPHPGGESIIAVRVGIPGILKAAKTAARKSKMVAGAGIEPTASRYERDELPLLYPATGIWMVGEKRLRGFRDKK